MVSEFVRLHNIRVLCKGAFCLPRTKKERVYDATVVKRLDSAKFTLERWIRVTNR